MFTPSIRIIGSLLVSFITLIAEGTSFPSSIELRDQFLSKAHRHQKAGWIYLHVEGTPRERGFQHGYLLAKEIAESIEVTRVDWEYQSATKWTWLQEKASAMFLRKVHNENLAELDGIVEGMQHAGVATSRSELIAYKSSRNRHT